jgi:phosphatidylserine decarboxylase
MYGENVRKIAPIDGPQFGRVMAVCHQVGAMMVGSIKTTVEVLKKVNRLKVVKSLGILLSVRPFFSRLP